MQPYLNHYHGGVEQHAENRSQEQNKEVERTVEEPEADTPLLHPWEAKQSMITK